MREMWTVDGQPCLLDDGVRDVRGRARSPEFSRRRGRVVETITGDAALASINELSRKYTGGDYAPEIQSERVILKIAPDREVTR